jgi:hypothetical protein
MVFLDFFYVYKHFNIKHEVSNNRSKIEKKPNTI